MKKRIKDFYELSMNLKKLSKNIFKLLWKKLKALKDFLWTFKTYLEKVF